ncbi:MAG: hypothetical protein QOH76_2921 [Thermoleophilaceae bacterium]|jgi:hypothetical protein|nr:hypothetical protein [Thermoleophilaceae bacterium]
MKSSWTRDVSLLLMGAALVAGCGGGDKFKNEARPPTPVQLTGVVTDRGVTISPKRVGAGPVILTVSNQTDSAHTITLEGNGKRDIVGPVNPLGTAKLQQTLEQGTYTVKVGSKQATANFIPPGELIVGASRPSSSDELLLP